MLIVDDHHDGATALGRLFTRRGCEVRIAFDGIAGLAAAREHRPDVLLLDLGLPGMDGFELARTLRAEPPFAAALLIAISGYATDADRARCLAAGFDEHCAKPVDFQALVQMVTQRKPRERLV